MVIRNSIVMLFLATIFPPTNVLASQDQPTITITGNGLVYRDPDTATIRIGVTRSAPTTVETQNEVNSALNSSIEAIRELEVDGLQIETTTLSIDPEYVEAKEKGEPRVLTGYTATREVSVHISDVSRVGEVIDTAIAGGINRLRSVYFSLSDPIPARLDALTAATEDAKKKAKKIASGLDLQVGQVNKVDEASARYRNESVLYSRQVEAQRSRATQINPSPVRVSAEVSITWTLIDKP